jgi:hypothetical protein
MADKNVDINIRTKADSREVKRYDDAHRDLEDTLKDSVYTVEDLHDWLEKKREEEEKAAKLAKNEEEREVIRANARANQAQVLGVIGDKIGQLGSRLVSIGRDIGEVDKELGKTIESMGRLGETTGSVVTGAAAGFAVGGPIGAALGGLAGVVKSLYDTWLEGQKQVAEAQKKVTDATNDYREALIDLGEEQAQGNVSRFQQRLQNELNLLRDQNEEIKHQNELAKLREDSEKRIAATQRQIEIERIQFLLKRGEISDDQALSQITEIQANARRSTASDATQNQDRRLAELQLAEDTQGAKIQAIQNGLNEIDQLKEGIQNFLNSQGEIQSVKELQEVLAEAPEIMRKFNVNLIKDKAEARKTLELFEGETLSLLKTRDEENAKRQEISQEIKFAREKREVILDAEINEFKASNQAELQKIAQNFQEGNDFLKPLFEDAKKRAGELGIQNSEQVQELLSVMEQVVTDNQDDRTQINLFRQKALKLNELIRQDNQTTIDGINKLLAARETDRSALQQVINRLSNLEAGFKNLKKQ